MGIKHIELEEGSPAQISEQGLSSPVVLDVFPETAAEAGGKGLGICSFHLVSLDPTPILAGSTPLTASFPPSSPHSQKSWRIGEPRRRRRTLCGNQPGTGCCSGTAGGSALAPSCTELLAARAGWVSGPRGQAGRVRHGSPCLTAPLRGTLSESETCRAGASAVE